MSSSALLESTRTWSLLRHQSATGLWDKGAEQTFSSFLKSTNIDLKCDLSFLPARTLLSERSTSFAILSQEVPPATVLSRESKNSCASRLHPGSAPPSTRSNRGGGIKYRVSSIALSRFWL